MMSYCAKLTGEDLSRYLNKTGFLKVANFKCRTSMEDHYASPKNHHAKFLPIGQITAEIWQFFSIFQDGGRLPSSICFTRVWTTHEA